MKLLKTITLLLALMVSDFVVAIEPIATDIVVRAKARDGKFIGSSVGGAFIRIKDAESGQVLAEGLTEGSTGNTQLIMKQAKQRHQSITEGAAFFKATLNIDKPIFLTIEVLSPYIKRQATTLSQTQTWLVPGKAIDGEGLIIEVPGMIVDVLAPQTHKYTSIKNSPFELKANVVMMCGCIITKGGIWNGDTIEVTAIITKNGDDFQTITLKKEDVMNIYSSSFAPDSAGIYQVTIYAYDPQTGNTGVDKTSFVVTN